MVVNDNAGILDERGAFGFFASKLAPTGIGGGAEMAGTKKAPRRVLLF